MALGHRSRAARAKKPTAQKANSVSFEMHG
jgi:hypothetical protein